MDAGGARGRYNIRSHARGVARGKYSHARSSETQPPPSSPFLQLVIGGQKISIQPSFIFCKKIQSWRSEDKHPIKLYLLQESSVIGGQTDPIYIGKSVALNPD